MTHRERRYATQRLRRIVAGIAVVLLLAPVARSRAAERRPLVVVPGWKGPEVEDLPQRSPETRGEEEILGPVCEAPEGGLMWWCVVPSE